MSHLLLAFTVLFFVVFIAVVFMIPMWLTVLHPLAEMKSNQSMGKVPNRH